MSIHEVGFGLIKLTRIFTLEKRREEVWESIAGVICIFGCYLIKSLHAY